MARLHRRSFARGWSAQEYAALLAEETVSAFIVASGGRSAGFVVVRAAAEEAEILMLAVDGDHRRRGIATSLVDAALAAASTRGTRTVFLEVAADNHPARALYERAGFNEIARRPNYYAAGRAVPAEAVVLGLQIASRVDAGAAGS